MLLSDEKRRMKMAEYGYERIKNLLSWEIQEKNLKMLYSRLFNTYKG
jgi:glycosyltransferase involved in cell wall biosynthesis